MTKYYFAIASKKFLLFDEPTEEILRERTNYYNNTRKPIDFWLIKKPSILDVSEIIQISKKLNTPLVAVVSTNNLFITWLKLRFHFVVTGIFVKDTLSHDKSIKN